MKRKSPQSAKTGHFVSKRYAMAHPERVIHEPKKKRVRRKKRAR